MVLFLFYLPLLLSDVIMILTVMFQYFSLLCVCTY